VLQVPAATVHCTGPSRSTVVAELDFPSFRASRWLVLLALALVQCGPFGAAQGKCSTSTSAVPTPTLPIRRIEHRPSLTLVQRQGDPAAAVALAAVVPEGSRVSILLAALFESRLHNQNTDVIARAGELGLTLTALGDTPARVHDLTRDLLAAVATPVQPQELRHPWFARALKAFVPEAPGSDTATDMARCSGELVQLPGHAWPTEIEAIDLGALEAARKQVYSCARVSIAVVGNVQAAESAAAALAEAPEWPEGTLPAVTPHVLGVTATEHGDAPGAHISLAFYLGTSQPAVNAALRLRAPDSPLAKQLRAIDPRWRVRRALATPHTRGACLRLDLEAPLTPSPLSAVEAEQVCRVAFDESRRALDLPAPSDIVAREVRAIGDPRVAAGAAAWTALSSDDPALPTQTRLEIDGWVPPEPSASESVDIESWLLPKPAPRAELRALSQQGQGELWALIATPCVTSDETSLNSGTTAVLLRGLAAQSNQHPSVRFEPWITADGAGLVAHAEPISATETPIELAARLGSALGFAWAVAQPAQTEWAEARRALLHELGPERRIGFWHALQSMAPDRPGLISPLGTLDSVGAANISRLQARRAILLRYPLRVAVLANDDPNQAAEVERASMRWVGPHRLSPLSCPAATAPLPVSEDLRVGAAEQTEPAPATFAIALNGVADSDEVHLAWLVYLLTRTGGWLDQALLRSSLATSAHATLVGGHKRRALVVRVGAVESELDDAIAQTRALFRRLASGNAVTEKETAEAHAWYRAAWKQARLSPRRRLVDLWLGNSGPQHADIRSFRQFLRRALGNAAVTTVRVGPLG